MAHPTPLLAQLENADVQFMSFGRDIAIVAVHESVEVEYGSVRKTAAIMDCPHRGLIELRGKDRTDFLHRLLTHDIKQMQAGGVQRQFLLTAAGRIMADLRVKQETDRTLIETDTPESTAPTLTGELNKMLFGEQVRITDMTQSHHCLAIHGPRTEEVIAQLGLENAIRIEQNVCGTPGSSVWIEREAASSVWAKARELHVMPLGWLAFNMARIEAGTPLFHVDFGPDCVPHETGIVKQVCSFTKGCYRGQEIVARMESSGHPSKVLVGFISTTDALPVAGAEVLDKPPEVSPQVPPPLDAPPDTSPPDLDSPDFHDAKVVGAVTSSTLSPMLSAKPVGFAMVKWGLHSPGTELFTAAEGATVAIKTHALEFVSNKGVPENPPGE